MKLSSKHMARLRSFIAGQGRGKCMRNILIQAGLDPHVAKQYIYAFQQDVHGMNNDDRKRTLSKRQKRAKELLEGFIGEAMTDDFCLVKKLTEFGLNNGN
jgi:hypothetical protein